ncbi:MAG: DNA polymerase III subunit alpha [Sphingomonadales bacterium]|nr:DNA polymerase III subunit alpha [Sphingomonadales bacterium]PIX66730.1 MAG: DNA polymerase III subunit alpha [Sphingomonadales bacterium CG_4_10_14_3_um_filter_58_15]NCO47936.1 DNA polymerase III subunit alpha [Sphingomonadales bacterium]NCP01059.1 DNA polymerase III subunit alpha [Sphingomonadales bacterium]NCP26428.1 DNA polymerase III subunit alpha [Sphingomonadales bacterium]
MAQIPFVHLRTFSAYTILDGAMEPAAIGPAAKERGFPAVALCDRIGLFASMAFDDGCRANGVQPITGCFLRIARPGSADPSKPALDWLALYAQDAEGYENLCKLVSASHLDRPSELEAHVGMDFLGDHSAGLIALTGGGEGAVARLIAEEQQSEAEAYLSLLQQHFQDRLYIELSRREDPVEIAAESGLIALAMDRDIPLVATNPSCFSEPDFHEAHDAMKCIAQSAYVENNDREKPSKHLWMKSALVMEDLFADIPEALQNTLVIAQRCAFSPPKRDPILPSLAGDLAGEIEQLRRDATAGLERRLAVLDVSDEPERKIYFDRLAFELDVIVSMGFPGYFLIVADFIKWAKDHDIPVGPGRGSGAGSVVAWALTITDLDPIKLGLLFERFLNPERVSMPDFDIDFCETRRGEVIRYVQEKYGDRQVAQIITFGKLKARAVLRDVGRVLQMPYGQVDRLTKLIPNHPTDPWDLKRSLNGISELAQEYKQADVKRLFDLAMKLEGLPRHSSTHAAGVVIGDRPLDQLVPLYRDPRSDLPVTQFDMKYVEKAGLVKFDFLGLKTLSVLKKAVELLAERGITVDLDGLSWEDEKVFELLQRGETVGVFQLESEGMRRTLAAVKPTNFGDIIALVSLYRPGPMDNIPLFGDRKNGRAEIAYPHPLLQDILKETYGIFVYQEQVMQAAQIIAGYSLGEADLLRRAMGKKIQAEMDTQRSRFVSGAAENGLKSEQANELFDLIDKFAGYGFNKSHAAAYALLAYQTAWLKAHHPHEFYAASMCFDMHQSDKLSIFVDDMKRLGVTVLAPAINKSRPNFSVEEQANAPLVVRYALAGLKNVGEKAMQSLVTERSQKGPFSSIEDLANRIDPHGLNKRQLESLASAGAFDELEPNRAAIYDGADMILSVANSAADARESGQGGLFGEGSAGGEMQAIRLPANSNWSLSEIMVHERDAFGFYFSAHPVSQFQAVTASLGALTYAALCSEGPIGEGVRKPSVMAALIEKVRWRDSRRGKRFALADLSDSSGQFSASCFEEEQCKILEEIAGQGGCALLNVELDQRSDDESPRVAIRRVQPLEGLEKTTRTRMELEVHDIAGLHELTNLVAPLVGGQSELVAIMAGPDGDLVKVCLGRSFRLDAETVEMLERVNGISGVRLGPARTMRVAKPKLRLVS